MFPLTRRSSVANTDATRDESRLRVFATRLDMALKRAKISSGQVAKALGVHETDVQFWRAGITAPVLDQCRRLAEYLNVPAQWLACDVAM